ncbi:hypothetical protein JB92DRAFT_3105997 [Gautieria morchelliformis]|nr:hypothetical protein JB92DRAFT_3105997 [Gautieria morchelliformis]
MSSSSTKYMLPGELIDQVIDHLHDDLPSLRACCLTCRAWVPSARFHIFYNIVLSAKRAHAFARVRRMRRAAGLLKPSPHISLLVRSLTIDGGPRGTFDRRLDYLDAHPNVLSALISNFSALQELRISSVTFNGFRDLAALIVAHPFLECLDLTFVSWKSETAASRWENVFQEYPDLRSRLRCIKLDYISLSMIDWMSSYYHVLPAHTVTRSPNIFIRDIPRMARLFKLIGSSLEHLTFHVYECKLESREETNMDLLSYNRGLRSLTFNKLRLSPYGETYAWLPVLLSQVKSTYIEEISFVLIWHKINLLERVNLKLVQEIITKPVFNGLKSVIFQWASGTVDPVEGSQAITAQMDQLNRMGLLVFRCADPF